MATLTWRNVDAPDFRGSIDGIRTASDLLGRAVSSAQTGIGQYTDAVEGAADRAILNRALGIQDPEQMKTALASGQIVGDLGGKASMATLRGLDSRVGNLLNQAVTAENLSQTQYNNTRTREGNALMDQNQGVLNQISTAMRAGNVGEANRLGATLNMRPEQVLDFMRQATAGGTQGQALVENLYGWGRTLRDNADSDSAQTAVMDIVRKFGSPAEATAKVDQLVREGKLTPGAFSRLNSLLERAGYANGFGPVSGSPGSSGGGAAIAGAGTMTGGAQLPAGIQTVGDMVDTLDPNGRNSTLLKDNPAGTATGIYQITGATWKQFAQQALGDNWRGANIRDPEVQDKVGKAIWDSAKGSAQGIAGRWASISASEATRLVNRPWEEVRGMIAQRESSTSPEQVAALNIAGAASRRDVQDRFSQNTATGLSKNYDDLLGDRRELPEVVDSLTQGERAPFRGTNRGFLTGKINHIVRESRGRINPAMAGAMLVNSIDQADNIWEKLWRGPAILGGKTMSPNLAGGIRINEEDLQQRFNDYLSGATSGQVSQNNALAATDQLVAAAQQAYNVAEQEYQQRVVAAGIRPGLSTEAAKLKRDTALARFEQVRRDAQGNERLRPQFDQSTP